METMGRAYEDMQAQNSRLLQKLTEKDDAHNQLLAERLMGQHHLQEQQLELKHQEAERHARDAADPSTLKEGLEKEVTKLTSEVVALLTTKLERLRKAAAASGGGAAGVRELQEEVDAMRQLLNCNVCHERQKNVIITKCCHVFCDKCIKRNLESRNRKCPGCGVPFGQADVKPFYYT